MKANTTLHKECPHGLKAAIAGVATLAVLASNASAADWTWNWTPSGSTAPTAQVTPLKYGKTWAYSVEIDDSSKTTISNALPLLTQYKYTDAPPGISGGNVKSFVGGAGVMGVRTDGNGSYLSWDDIIELKSKGWGILNHSYWHSGASWDPNGALQPADFRRELYWSQGLIAALSGTGRGSTHFIYPNGYIDYSAYLGEFGMVSGSRVAGGNTQLLNQNINFKDLNRNNLDEGNWPNAMDGMPSTHALGDWVIDFTHGIDDPGSANNTRWNSRESSIASQWGQNGNNTIWSAPSDEVANYNIASRAATVQVQNGQLSVHIPDTIPGSELTIKLSGIAASVPLTAPSGGLLYRQGTDVWVTTPMLGQAGAEAPKLKRVYKGAVQNVTLTTPEKVAGVRIHQFGDPTNGQIFDATLVAPDNSTKSIAHKTLTSNWGDWHLFNVTPDAPAYLTKQVNVTAGLPMIEMEIWALDEGGSPTPTATPTPTPAPTATPTPTPPAGTGNGTGLKGQYFNDLTLANLIVTHTEPTVDFDWGSGSPSSGSIGDDNFSARWSGQVQAMESGSYTFTTTTDDGVRLWVNNQLLVDKWQDQAPLAWSGTITLTAGQKYDIKMEYYEAWGGAMAKLQWQRPGQSTAVVIPQSQLYPTAPPAAGTGLKGQYFNDMTLNNLILTRTDATVNFDWGYDSPANGIGSNNFSTRWTGQVQAVESGSYTFTTTTDDGVRLWVNSQLLVDQWVPQGPTTWSGTINLTAGQKYDIKMEYYEDGGGAVAQLQWQRPGQSTPATIPQTQLFPAP